MFEVTSAAVEGFSSEDVSSFLRDHELAIATFKHRVSYVPQIVVPSLSVEDIASFHPPTVADSSQFAEEIATLLQAITTSGASIDQPSGAPPCTPTGTATATAPRSSRFSKESWDESPKLSSHRINCCGGDVSQCPRCDGLFCLTHAFPIHMIACGEDADEPWTSATCFASNCADPHNVVRCEKCTERPQGHLFACPAHMPEHLEDDHSFKRAVLSADIGTRPYKAAPAGLGPERTTVPHLVGSSHRSTSHSSVPGFRTGSRPLSVGGDHGGRGAHRDGASRRPPQSRLYSSLAFLDKKFSSNPIFVPISGGMQRGIPPNGDTRNYREQPRPYAAAAGGSRGGGTAPLGGLPSDTHITHIKKAVAAGASPP